MIEAAVGWPIVATVFSTATDRLRASARESDDDDRQADRSDLCGCYRRAESQTGR